MRWRAGRERTVLVIVWLLLVACGATDKDGGVETDGGATGDGGVETDGGATGDSGSEVLPAGALIIDHVAVVDAAGVREDAAVIVVADEVWEVRAAGGEWPADATVQDWSHEPAATVIPGLIDAHVHLFLSGSTWWVGDTLADNLAAQLSWGVTGVFDVGSPVELYTLRDRIAAGELIGPRILSSGPMITAELSHPCETVPDEHYCRFVDGDGAEVVAELAGADVLKAALADADFTPWPTPRLDLADLAEVAAASEQPLFVHIDEPEDAADALAAGADVLAHTVFSSELSPAELAEIATAPTLSTHGAFAAPGALMDGSLLADDLSHTPAVVVEAWQWTHDNPEVFEEGWFEATAEWEAAVAANLGAMIASGAPVLAGSDAGYWYVPHGLGLHRELEALVAAGMTPREALAAATSAPAELAGWEDRGFVAAGYRADLVVLRARPDLEISATREIAAVYLGGEVWDGRLWSTAGDGSTCLDDRDCPDIDQACDLVDHVCRPSCEIPYDRVGSCDAETWCMPVDALDTTPTGVCHPGDGCDLYTQDCEPASYEQACVPTDLDTNRCLPSGDRVPGQTCSYTDPDYYCEVGSFCSWVDWRCYQLCEPEGHVPTADCARCVEQVVEGEGWFGVCL